MKEKASLGRITKWMEANKKYASHMRVLVIDDEADNATPNSNAGKDAMPENPEDIVEDMAAAMRECEADDYNDLADWLEGLLQIEPPDDAESTDEAKAFKNLALTLDKGNAKDQMQKILHGENGDYSLRELLGLDLTAAETTSADGSWQTDVTGEPLYIRAQNLRYSTDSTRFEKSIKKYNTWPTSTRHLQTCFMQATAACRRSALHLPRASGG